METPESHRLAALAAYAVLDTDPERLLDDLTTLAATVFGTPIALVSLVDAHRQWFKSRYGLAAEETPREHSFCSVAIQTPDQVMVIPDAHVDPRFSNNPLVTGEPNVRFYAGAPIIGAGGAPLGAMCVIDRVPRTFTDEQAQLLRTISRQVALVMRLRLLQRVTASGGGQVPASGHTTQSGDDDKALRVTALAARGADLRVFVDRMGVVRAANATAADFWGRDGAVEGLALLDLATPAAAREQIRGAMQATYAGETRALQARLTFAERGVLTMELLLTPVRDDQERVVGLVLDARDVTRARALEEELRRTIAALETRNQSQEQMIHILSHDLREPLNSITNFAGLMLDEAHPITMEEHQRYALYVHQSGTRLKTLVDDLRSFVSLDRHSGPRETVRLDVLMGEVLQNLASAVMSSGAEVKVEPLPAVAGSGMLLGLLFQNLISNALKFVAQGVVPQVVVSAVTKDDGWEVTVADNGIGIAPRHQGVVFDLFRRLHPRDRYDGTGMGLALCRRVAELHDGQISLASTPGVGSKFVVHLPKVARSVLAG